ncbi:hypothetical protein PIB30_057997 [Stylosanthes scabra]|uniref:Late embryogenesis abundant protein LEA-2 subgroup domain-containing protein n=1 Tax=Stylosanthes scabra TaxID=79078 RepID=A0ABU6XHT1_9FABA|nr:hypothetical protein [Stylosanthes scabra]
MEESRQGVTVQVTNPDKPPRRACRASFDNESFHDLEVSEFRDKIGRSCWFMICAWACIVAFTILIVLLFMGISYLAFLQSGLPKVCVRQLNIAKLELDPQDKLSTSVVLLLRMANKNGKLSLVYSPVDVLVQSEGITLGENRIDNFSQKPHDESDFPMTMETTNADTDKHAVEELKSDMDAKEVMYDVFVSGKIGFKMADMEMANVPFVATCRDIKQSEINLGRRPECDVHMFGFR